ncbi:putative ankyrin repeat-containing domain superfamily [Helianthus annuus]|nr:putative ankyrin repeat-containing domain superfamily [Helianthus annuus]
MCLILLCVTNLCFVQNNPYSITPTGLTYFLSCTAFASILYTLILITRRLHEMIPYCAPIYKSLQHMIMLLPLHIKFVKEEAEMHNVATRLLKAICELIKRSTATRSHSDYYNNAILEATRQNADKVVRVIVSFFPNAIWSANEEGHNIIQYAVINRSEKVYNLLYQMSEHKNIYRTIKDTFGNNLLHLAAKLAPPDKLNHISGAALHLQRELQWFKVAIFV